MVVQLGQVIISLKMNFTLYVNQVIEMAKFNVNQMIQNNCKCFFKNIEHLEGYCCAAVVALNRILCLCLCRARMLRSNVCLGDRYSKQPSRSSYDDDFGRFPSAGKTTFQQFKETLDNIRPGKRDYSEFNRPPG